MEPLKTQYAHNGETSVAYQVFGQGDTDLVFVPGFISHIDNYWDDPNFARWLRRLGTFFRVLMFDKQGTGLSDRASSLPGMDERMDDVRAVMDAQGIGKACLFGISEGGSLATLFAAHNPDRTQALILYGAFARFTAWFPTKRALENLFNYIDTAWGSGESLSMFAPSMKDDPTFKQWWARFEKLGGSPGAVKALMRMNSRIDITDILHTVYAPTLVIHRKDDVAVSCIGGRSLAEHIPNAKYIELPGIDHLPMVGENSDQIIDEIARFITGRQWRSVETERILATVLFTDIVNSTHLATELGDRQWRDLLEDHHTLVRRELNRFRGQEVDTAGDGFFATFDGPARAITCACAIRDVLFALGIETRAGLHTGECEMIGGKVGGIAVHIGSRVMHEARPGEILVSSTVKDLVAGSGLVFNNRGKVSLKGIPDKWRLFSVDATI